MESGEAVSDRSLMDIRFQALMYSRARGASLRSSRSSLRDSFFGSFSVYLFPESLYVHLYMYTYTLLGVK